MVTINVYKELKKGKVNPSPNTLSFFRKYPYARVFVVADNSKVSLKSLLKIPLNQVQIIIGTPKWITHNEGVFGKTSSFIIGAEYSHICTKLKKLLLPMNTKGKNVWAVDITQNFIDEYKKFGMCAFHDARHEFVNVSPKKKACKYCGAVYRSKVVVVKKLEWNKVENGRK